MNSTIVIGLVSCCCLIIIIIIAIASLYYFKTSSVPQQPLDTHEQRVDLLLKFRDVVFPADGTNNMEKYVCLNKKRYSQPLTDNIIIQFPKMMRELKPADVTYSNKITGKQMDDINLSGLALEYNLVPNLVKTTATILYAVEYSNNAGLFISIIGMSDGEKYILL